MRAFTPALAAALSPLALLACVGGDETQNLSAEVEGVPEGAETIMVAGGCFWCVEKDFEKKPYVYEVVSGYAGGEGGTPTYETHKELGFREVAVIYYDPGQASYDEIARTFLRTIDPFDAGGQFCDRGHSYTTALYYGNADERGAAQAAIEEAEAVLGEEIVTAIEPESTFTAAEAYHQDFYEKSALRYEYYRRACGRDQRVEAVWGDEAEA